MDMRHGPRTTAAYILDLVTTALYIVYSSAHSLSSFLLLSPLCGHLSRCIGLGIHELSDSLLLLYVLYHQDSPCPLIPYLPAVLA